MTPYLDDMSSAKEICSTIMHDMRIIRRINGVRHFPHLKNKENKEKIYSQNFLQF